MAKNNAKKKTASLLPTKAEKTASEKRALEEAKKHGFKTVNEYIKYIDKKRGY